MEPNLGKRNRPGMIAPTAKVEVHVGNRMDVVARSDQVDIDSLCFRS